MKNFNPYKFFLTYILSSIILIVLAFLTSNGIYGFLFYILGLPIILFILLILQLIVYLFNRKKNIVYLRSTIRYYFTIGFFTIIWLSLNIGDNGSIDDNKSDPFIFKLIYGEYSHRSGELVVVGLISGLVACLIYCIYAFKQLTNKRSVVNDN